jgi:hypothetical protein
MATSLPSLPSPPPRPAVWLHPRPRHPNPESGDAVRADGSWCDIELTTAEDGSRRIREAGPTPLWAHVEHAYQLWHQHNQPSWQRFGLTVTETSQRVWLDHPNDPHRWDLNAHARTGPENGL